MRSEIDNVDSIGLQQQLDLKFGAGVFAVVVDAAAHKFYLEYADGVDAALASQALELAVNEANRKLSETRRRLHDQIDRMSQKTIARYSPKPPSSQVLDLASAWLADTLQPCPAELTKTAMLAGTTPIQAAQNITAAGLAYQTFLVNVAQQRDQSLQDLLTAETVAELKSTATVAATYFNDLEKSFTR
jgi:hypothetical protein